MRDDRPQWAGFNTWQTQYLDTVRGLAAQLVLLQHAADYFLNRTLPGELGNLGVALFFLLSGFLITDGIRARLAVHRFSLLEFGVSRFTRIFLPYLPTILFVAVIDYVSSSSPSYQYAADYNWPTALANVFMLQDFSVFQLLRRLHVPDQPWFFREFGSARQAWTISIEWWIYVAVGIATTLLVSPRRRPVLMALLCFGAIEPLYNLIGGPGNSLTGFWLLGGIASVLYRSFYTAAVWSKRTTACLAGLCISLALLRLLYTHFVVYDFVFVAIVGTLLFLPVYSKRLSRTGSVWRVVGLDRLALYSYSLYLTHYSILVLIVALSRGRWNGFATFLLSILVANLAAIPFACLFEFPQKHVRQWLLRTLQGRLSISPDRHSPSTVSSPR